MDQVKPSLTISFTQAQLENQNITFDQPGVSFDDARYQFGGVYNSNQDVVPQFSLTASLKQDIPSFVVSIEKPPSMVIAQTDAKLADQKITFDQAGVSFDDSRYQFGGVYNFGQDVVPILADAYPVTPHIRSIQDVGAIHPFPPGSLTDTLLPIGLGYLTYE